MSSPRAFYSDPTAYIIMWRGLVLTLGSLIIAAVVVGQIRGGRFPAYRDLAICISLPFVAYAILAAITYVCCYFFPVCVDAVGIKSTNLFGMPALVAWRQIRSADVREVQGIPYIFVEAEGRSQPVTIPVWLRNPKEFVQAVKEFAEPSNPLAQLVAGATAQQAGAGDAERGRA